MIADGVLRLISDRMGESHLDKNNLKWYVKYIDDIFSLDIVKSSKDDNPRKSTIDDLRKGQHRDASFQMQTNQIEDNDKFYLFDDRIVLWNRSWLGFVRTAGHSGFTR